MTKLNISTMKNIDTALIRQFLEEKNFVIEVLEQNSMKLVYDITPNLTGSQKNQLKDLIETVAVSYS